MEELESIYKKVYSSRILKGDRTKLRMIQSAIRLIGQEGAENLTFESVGKELGVAAPQVKYHFQEKRDLIQRAVEFVLYCAQESFLRNMKRARSWDHQIYGMIDGLFDWADDFPEQRGAFVLFYYSATYDPERKKMHDQMLATGFNRMRVILKSQQGTHGKTKTEIEFLSKAIWANAFGSLIYYLSSSKEEIDYSFRKTALKAARRLLER